MTNITTPRPEADQADTLHAELAPGTSDATTPSTGPARSDSGRRRHLAPLLAIGISAGAAALAVVAITTDDVASKPGSGTVTAVQPVDYESVPDGVPCPDHPARGQSPC